MSYFIDSRWEMRVKVYHSCFEYDLHDGYNDNRLPSGCVLNQKDLELGPYCIPTLGRAREWCGRDLIRADLRPVSPSLSSRSVERQGNQKEKKQRSCVIPTLFSKPNTCSVPRSRQTAKNNPPLPTFNSNVDVSHILITVELLALCLEGVGNVILTDVFASWASAA